MTELEDQLRTGPDGVDAILHAAKRPLSLTEPPFWHGLAQGSGQNTSTAFNEGGEAIGLAWARSAIEIYDALTEDVRGSKSKSASFELSSIHLRAQAIRACGVREGDRVLDPLIVIEWARHAIVFSVEEAISGCRRHPLDGGVKNATCMADTCTPFPP